MAAPGLTPGNGETSACSNADKRAERVLPTGGLLFLALLPGRCDDQPTGWRSGDFGQTKVDDDFTNVRRRRGRGPWR